MNRKETKKKKEKNTTNKEAGFWLPWKYQKALSARTLTIIILTSSNHGYEVRSWYRLNVI